MSRQPRAQLLTAAGLLGVCIGLWAYMSTGRELPGDLRAITAARAHPPRGAYFELLLFFGTAGTALVALITVAVAATVVAWSIGLRAAALVAGAAAPAPAPAPSPPAGASYVGLTVGSSGALVKDLQRALVQAGLTLRGGADGVFGNMTRTTLVQFQLSQGREQTGVIGGARSASPCTASAVTESRRCSSHC